MPFQNGKGFWFFRRWQLVVAIAPTDPHVGQENPDSNSIYTSMITLLFPITEYFIIAVIGMKGIGYFSCNAIVSVVISVKI
jgi:hypothetical protein